MVAAVLARTWAPEALKAGDGKGSRSLPTGTECSLGSRGLWSSSGIGKGTCGFFRDSWKGGVSTIWWSREEGYT